MINIFKNKSVVVKAYTLYNNGIHKFYAPSKPKIPDWVNKLPAPSSIDIARELADKKQSIKNIRHCPGRIDLYKKGIMVPMWSDLYLRVGPRNEDYWKYQYADAQSSIKCHPYNQYSSMVSDKEYLQIKLVTPWTFSTDRSLEFLALKPAWEVVALQGLEILPGVLNFYKVTQVMVNLFIKKQEEEQEFLIKAGTPICHFVPLEDVKLKIDVSSVSPNDPMMLDRIRHANHCFTGSYHKQK